MSSRTGTVSDSFGSTSLSIVQRDTDSQPQNERIALHGIQLLSEQAALELVQIRKARILINKLAQRSNLLA